MVETLLIIMRKVVNMRSLYYYKTYRIYEYYNSVNRFISRNSVYHRIVYAWYSGVEFEQYFFLNRATGPYWWSYNNDGV